MIYSLFLWAVLLINTSINVNSFKVIGKTSSLIRFGVNNNIVKAQINGKNIEERPQYVKVAKQLGPILASAFCVAALMYPVDLIRALQMANAGSSNKLSTAQLLSKFKDSHGLSGFFTQGLAPELARSTWMRFVKFGNILFCLYLK